MIFATTARSRGSVKARAIAARLRPQAPRCSHTALPPASIPSSRPHSHVLAMPQLNGVDGLPRPETPAGGMALTEYSANPSPPSERRERLRGVVPDDLLLPDGYPDVRRRRPMAAAQAALTACSTCA